MRILFISDNRDAPNWGCRATSEALESLIKSLPGVEPEFKTLGIVDVHMIRPYSPLFPEPFTVFQQKVLLSRNAQNKFKRTIARSIYILLYPFFQKPFLYHDTIPNSEKELGFFEKLFQDGKTLRRERELLEWADVVFANGEGAFYQDERKGKYIIFLLYLAKTLFKKPAILANHMFDVKSDNLMSLCRKIYPLLDDVVFRDNTSLEIFRKNVAGVSAKAAPDAAFAFKPTGKEFSQYLVQNPKLMDTYYGHANEWGSFKKPFVILGGSSILNKAFFVKDFDAEHEFTLLVNAMLRENIRVVLCVACLGDLFLKKIAIKLNLPLISVETSSQLAVDFFAEASCFVSGRYHPMILTSVSGTPTMIFDSNSHKTRSLHELMGLSEQPYFELKNLRADTPKIIEHLKAIMSHEASLRQRILQNVNALRPDVYTQVRAIERFKKRP